MNARDSARSKDQGDNDTCTRAWARLEQADAHLRTAGGQEMEAPLEAFHDAWGDRLTALATGDTSGDTMKRVGATLRLMEQAAATPQAIVAMAAFVSIAVLEVEVAVVRSAGNDTMTIRFAAGTELDHAPIRGSC